MEGLIDAHFIYNGKRVYWTPEQWRRAIQLARIAKDEERQPLLPAAIYVDNEGVARL